MQARFSGKCRDCGNKFPAGTDIDWQRGQGASCCNGSPQVAPKAAKSTSSPMVVDGAQRMEWVDGKTTQEVVGFQGDSLVYEQKEYSGYSWMCLGCRLVWERQHQAINCEKRDHVASFEQSYGGTVWDGRGFTPHGLVAGKYLPGTGTTYVRTAIRREKSPDVPPVAPAPRHNLGCDGSGSHANGCTFGNYESTSSHQPGCDGSGSHKDGCTNGPAPVMEPHGRFPVEDYSGPVPVEYLPHGGTTDGKYSEWEPVNYPQVEEPAPQADPQDMTSEQLWDSMGPGTITTSWN